ncbi:serine/threonine protein kinase [Polyangium aurulentum]|uniref:serine/threonine protein kinase n=1 Tax=Polyangium aurulentum TaxID=2567896 RepID=UPI00146E4B1B|nr:serine/threonine-protein kinase [Polyangium aurulentum]UQA60510.1 protein kinase [Polyangium aurulentum]
MSALTEGSIIAGRYRLGRPLAKGGMGSVFFAEHVQLRTSVAIKLMAPALAASADARARFEREAQASAVIKSPHVVQVYDYGVEGDCPYIVMELLDGEDLEHRLVRVGRLSLAATMDIVQQVCKALRRAHELGVVHRDLKPANLFLSRHGDEELVKILDFGIAKANGPVLAGSATRTGTLIGSPQYMSPEQVRRGKEVDHRSDLWSLGVIAYRCVTGQLPFSGEELGDLLVEICTDPIPAPSSIHGALGPEVNRFFERALSRDVGKRFQSADELAHAFAAVVRGGGPISTSPSSQNGALGPPPASGPAPVSAPGPASGPGGTVVSQNGAFGPPPQSGPAPFSAPGSAPGVSSTLPSQIYPPGPPPQTHAPGPPPQSGTAAFSPPGSAPGVSSTLPSQTYALGPLPQSGAAASSPPGSAPGVGGTLSRAPASKARTTAVAVGIALAAALALGAFAWSRASAPSAPVSNTEGEGNRPASSEPSPAGAASAAASASVTTPASVTASASPTASASATVVGAKAPSARPVKRAVQPKKGTKSGHDPLDYQ